MTSSMRMGAAAGVVGLLLCGVGVFFFTSPSWRDTTDSVVQEEELAVVAPKLRLLHARVSSPAQEKLSNSHNTMYYASINIGTPPKQFNVVLDTGSFITWVPDQVCASPACHAVVDGRERHRFLVHDSSTGKVVGKVKHNGKTFVKEADMQYGTGNMQGVQVVDTMSMAGVSVPKVGFLVAVQVASRPFASAPFDGIMGLGRARLAQDGVLYSFMGAAAQKKRIPKDIISFYLSTKPSEGGVVVVGGTSAALHTGSIHWHPVKTVGPPVWALELSSLKIGDGANLCSKGCIGLVDTGTSLLVGGPALVSAAIKGLGFDQKFDCKNVLSGKAPDVEFVFGGDAHTYRLPAHAVTLEMKDAKGHKKCGPAIQAMMPPPHAAATTASSSAAPSATSTASAASEGSAAEGSWSVEQEVLTSMQGAGNKWSMIKKAFGGKEVVIIGDVFLRHHYAAFDNSDPQHPKVGFATAKTAVDLDAFMVEA